MAFDWSNYVDLAKWLTDNAESGASTCSAEAMYRSAISRAYYGAFQSAMALLVKRHEFQPKGDSTDHGEVYRAFKLHPAQPRKQIAVELDRLRNRRRLSDYDAAYLAADKDAQAAVTQARRVLGYLVTQ